MTADGRIVHGLRPETQAAAAALMVRAHRFFMNRDTYLTNAFQRGNALPETVNHQAQIEFDGAVRALTEAGIHIVVVDAPSEPEMPDAIFPNNWLSTHDDGTVVLYPLCHESRRPERQENVLQILEREHGFCITRRVDLACLEDDDRFVEGTGSLVLDRACRMAYACRSARTTAEGVETVCAELNYGYMLFHARDFSGRPVYHTNVMMSVGRRFAVVCGDVFCDLEERRRVITNLEQTGKEVVLVSEPQMRAFACNILELDSPTGGVVAMSRGALNALTPKQRRTIEHNCNIVPLAVDTIESHGGGGVRCMLAELFLPRPAPSAISEFSHQ